MNLDALQNLPTEALRSLAAALAGGSLAHGIARRPIQQLAGNAAEPVVECLTALVADGMRPEHLAVAVDAMAKVRSTAADPSTLMDLVMSGPNVHGYPTSDTAAAMNALVRSATQEVLLVGYAVHKGKQVFAPLAERMEQVPGLRVYLCLDIPRRHLDTSLASEIVGRFAQEFRKEHWPWKVLPELFYDHRSLSEEPARRTSLHAKCVVVDEARALVTSANFTEAAQERNIEVGVIVRYALMAARLSGYFRSLRQSGELVRVQL